MENKEQTKHSFILNILLFGLITITVSLAIAIIMHWDFLFTEIIKVSLTPIGIISWVFITIIISWLSYMVFFCIEKNEEGEYEFK